MEILRNGTIKKTRKPHVCCGCGKVIETGSTCLYQVNTSSDFGTVYLHEDDECIDAAYRAAELDY